MPFLQKNLRRWGSLYGSGNVSLFGKVCRVEDTQECKGFYCSIPAMLMQCLCHERFLHMSRKSLLSGWNNPKHIIYVCCFIVYLNHTKQPSYITYMTLIYLHDCTEYPRAPLLPGYEELLNCFQTPKQIYSYLNGAAHMSSVFSPLKKRASRTI